MCPNLSGIDGNKSKKADQTGGNLFETSSTLSRSDISRLPVSARRKYCFNSDKEKIFLEFIVRGCPPFTVPQRVWEGGWVH
jgi:hypothetical protein